MQFNPHKPFEDTLADAQARLTRSRSFVLLYVSEDGTMGCEAHTTCGVDTYGLTSYGDIVLNELIEGQEWMK